MAQSAFVNAQSTATEDALRRAVDTTPAFIHTGRPDGYLDYFNRGWLDFLGKSLEEVCGWRWTESVHPEGALDEGGGVLCSEAKCNRPDQLAAHFKFPLVRFKTVKIQKGSHPVGIAKMQTEPISAIRPKTNIARIG